MKTLYVSDLDGTLLRNDEPEVLEPLYEKSRDIYHCVYQKDIYTTEQWLEIMPKAASKSMQYYSLRN